MRVLCVSPLFPETYWGHERSMRLIGKRALRPPLGLLTVAALLPSDWEVRLCDMNVRPLDDDDLDWADVVFLSGMIVQRPSMLEVAARARARGRIVVVGGPHATATPDALAPYVDSIVVGEAEDLMDDLCAALLARPRTLPSRFVATVKPDIKRLPAPRYDLLDVSAYHLISVQWGRGCPFHCEFCDVVELFGRQARTKEPEQLCRELDAILATGFRGSLFVVDDNFVGNRKATLALLGPMAAWMSAHRYPFQIITEASIDLAGCDDLIAGMVAAGFDCVFVGIETPSKAALRETHKLQNLAVDLDQAIEKLIRCGLDVTAGFIMGFDADDAEALQRQREWVLRSPIPQAMIGVLNALPGTQLERRLAQEGRLLQRSDGETFGRPNFKTKLPESVLLQTYRDALAAIYEPGAYFQRCLRALQLRPNANVSSGLPWRYALSCLLRSLRRQGVGGSYRSAYWRFLGRALLRAPKRISRAVAMAIAGEHMIRYTREVVLPRLEEAIEEARADELVMGSSRAREDMRPGHVQLARTARAVASSSASLDGDIAQGQ